MFGFLFAGRVNRIWRELELLKRLFNLSVINFESGDKYLDTVKEIAVELNIREKIFPDRLTTYALLQGLDSRFTGVIQSLQSR